MVPIPSSAESEFALLDMTEEEFSRLSHRDRMRLLYEAEFLATEMERNRLAFFVPNLVQEPFIKAIGLGKKKMYFNCAANSTGKTTSVAQVLGNIFWGTQNQWFNAPVYRNWNFGKTAWYVSEPTALMTKVVPEIKKWFPRDRYIFTKAGRHFESYLKTDTGFELSLLSYDQKPKEFEAADVSILVLDEPPPRQIWTALATRTRGLGMIIFTMTPLYHSGWIFDEIINNPEQRKYIEVFYGDVEDVCSDHRPRGIMTHAQIEFLAQQYDEDEKEARLHGKPMHLVGNVIKEVDPNIHRYFDKEPQEFTQNDHTIYCAMDIHDRKPPAIIWAAVGRDGKKWVVDEYPNEPYDKLKSTTMTYPELAEMIKQRERRNGWLQPEYIIRALDPRYGRRYIGALGKTIQQIFGEHGLAFMTEINNDLTEGHALIRHVLKLDTDGFPNLRIWEKCINTWTSLTRYAYKEQSPKKTDSDGLSQRVEQRHKDHIDALRYFLMIAQPFHEISPPQKRRIILPREADVPVNLSDWEHDWRNPFRY